VRVNNVLIVEDHPLVSMATRNVIEGWGCDLRTYVCADAETTMAHLTEPGVEWFRIFLDLDVPGAYGLSLAKQIRGIGLHDRCTVMSALDRQDLIAEIQAMGFLGYIIKASSFAEFARAMNRVLAGDPSFPALTRVAASAPIRLTRRQEQMLDFVRRGLSSKEIASVCFVTEGTVNNCINGAMRALDVTSRSHAVARATELGLLTMNARDELPALSVSSKRTAKELVDGNP
jgi:DNA-binding NarL/FixJ family response regulator